MGIVSFDISMSLDGFITGANRRPEEPLGDGGEQLHNWAFNSDDERNRKILEGAAGLGAVITGRPSTMRTRTGADPNPIH